MKKNKCILCKKIIQQNRTFCLECYLSNRYSTLSSNYKHGKYNLKTGYCIDCHKKITDWSVRCKSCVNKDDNNPNYGNKGIKSTVWKGGKPKCKDCGKEITYKTKRCHICAAKKRINSDKHHLDLNTNNNKKSNILILTQKHHQQFHRLAYHYLLEEFGINEIKKYFKWFIKKKNITWKAK